MEEHWSSANFFRYLQRKVVCLKSEMQILHFYLVGQSVSKSQFHHRPTFFPETPGMIHKLELDSLPLRRGGFAPNDQCWCECDIVQFSSTILNIVQSHSSPPERRVTGQFLHAPFHPQCFIYCNYCNGDHVFISFALFMVSSPVFFCSL